MRKFFPNSLFVRTALIILFVLVASQLISIALFRYYAREPRAQFVAAGFISQLKTVRAALEVLPPERHAEFLQRLREERGLRVMPARDEVVESASDRPEFMAVRERLREQIDPAADIFLRPRADPKQPPNLMVKVTVAGREYWAVIPRSRVVEQDYTYAWLGWGLAGTSLALVAALLLIWRVNRPLEALAKSARELGQGRQPAPITEMGPEEVKQVAVAFNQMRDDLVRLDQERATFLAGVSHDLRTPLARLRLAVELLPSDPETRADIEGDIEDINGVINQFMDFARDESVEAIEVVDLNLLVRAAVERAQRGKQPIATDLPPLKPMPMRPLAMRRLITNLIDNAQKYGGDSVSVSSRLVGNETQLLVEDRGPGIPTDQTERLKLPFTRLDTSRAGGSGAGLGLAIVERVARLHGGRVELLPRSGGGTSVIVHLPL